MTATSALPTLLTESGIPWADPSGVRLRDWLGMSDEEFYDPARTALVPMGFCYPGNGPSGDLPPRRECAPLWHEPLLALLPKDRLTVIVGTYAQQRYAGEAHGTVTETVARWREFLPGRIVIPHPSPRNRGWLKKNPWFEAEALPAARDRVREVMHRQSARDGTGHGNARRSPATSHEAGASGTVSPPTYRRR